MVSKVNGIVIKAADAGENGKRLTVLTKEHGKMTLSVRGAKSSKKGMQAAAQLFSCCEFTVFEGRGFYSVTQADVIESFYGIRNDMERLAYGAFILEITERASFEELRNDRVFELLLRTLSVLSSGRIKPRLAAAVYILRLLKEYGFMGDFSVCPSCGKILKEAFYTDRADGAYCQNCVGDGAIRLEKGALKAVRYITESDFKTLFSFNVSDEVLDSVWRMAMVYGREYLGGKYKTLDYIEEMGF